METERDIGGRTEREPPGQADDATRLTQMSDDVTRLTERLTEMSEEEVRDRLRRRAAFLRELAEARELRRRVAPRRSRHAQAKAALRMNTFRAP